VLKRVCRASELLAWHAGSYLANHQRASKPLRGDYLPALHLCVGEGVEVVPLVNRGAADEEATGGLKILVELGCGDVLEMVVTVDSRTGVE